jgi:DNA polymerase III epsilon subunit family exonuclease
VVEIGAVRFRRSGQVTGQFEQLVNPGQRMSPAAQAIHGISDLDLAAAPAAREVLPHFLAFLGDPRTTSLVAHNASFDAGFLGSELRRAGFLHPDHRVFDTLSLARRCRPELGSHRLDCLVTALGLQSGPTHRALADAVCVKDLWIALHGPDTPGELLVSYPIHDRHEAFPPPHGWSMLDRAIASGQSVSITYEGGTRGVSPRPITPRRFQQKGGVAYVVAYCHLDFLEKSFRLDRIRHCEVLAAAEPCGHHVDPEAMNR